MNLNTDIFFLYYLHNFIRFCTSGDTGFISNQRGIKNISPTCQKKFVELHDDVIWQKIRLRWTIGLKKNSVKLHDYVIWRKITRVEWYDNNDENGVSKEKFCQIAWWRCDLMEITLSCNLTENPMLNQIVKLQDDVIRQKILR